MGIIVAISSYQLTNIAVIEKKSLKIGDIKS